jgi:hypothetical protein
MRQDEPSGLESSRSAVGHEPERFGLVPVRVVVRRRSRPDEHPPKKVTVRVVEQPEPVVKVTVRVIEPSDQP